MANSVLIRQLSKADKDALEKAGKIVHEVNATKIMLASLHNFVALERQNTYLNIRVQQLENALGYLKKAEECKVKAFEILKGDLSGF